MKVIFDLDDVLFDSFSFKKKIFSGLEEYNIPSSLVESLYPEHRSSFNVFRMYKDAVRTSGVPVSDEDLERTIDRLMQNLVPFVNEELLRYVHEIGIENCFVLTAGDLEHQTRKVNNSNITKVIPPDRIIIVQNDKAEELKKLSQRFGNEPIIFLDDKVEHINQAISIRAPHLYPVLFDKLGLEAFREVLSFCRRDEELMKEVLRVPENALPIA